MADIQIIAFPNGSHSAIPVSVRGVQFMEERYSNTEVHISADRIEAFMEELIDNGLEVTKREIND